MRCATYAPVLVLMLGLGVAAQGADRPARQIRSWLPRVAGLLDVPEWLQTLGAGRRRMVAREKLAEMAAVACREPFQFQVPAEVLKRLVEQPFDEAHGVEDVILDVPTTGTARTVGAVRLELVENAERAVFDLLISGTAVLHTTGNAGLAQVHSRTVARYSARKRLVLDEHGLKAYPAACRAESRSTIQRVTTSLPGLRGRIVRRIGWRRAQESLPEANQISARHSEQHICRLIDERLVPHIESVNLALSSPASGFRDGDEQPPLRLRFCTTDGCLSVVHLRNGPSALQPTTLHDLGGLRPMMKLLLSRSEPPAIPQSGTMASRPGPGGPVGR